MMLLVLGGSKCGKSSYAESLFSDFNGEKIYLATMRPFGDEAREAIERHRRARFGKGFSTLERSDDIGGAAIPEGAGVLLEDMGNLLANEMYIDEKIVDAREKILKGIEELQNTAELLVIVSNNVAADGNNYPKQTMLYIRHLSEINRAIAKYADKVVECVYNIPVVLKGHL